MELEMLKESPNKPGKSVNLNRVLVFGLVLFLARLFAGFLAGFIYSDSRLDLASIYRYGTLYGLDAVFTILVIAILAKRQVVLTLLHVALTVLVDQILDALFAWLVSSDLILTALFWLGLSIFLASVFVGTAIGIRMRRFALAG